MGFSPHRNNNIHNKLLKLARWPVLYVGFFSLICCVIEMLSSMVVLSIHICYKCSNAVIMLPHLITDQKFHSSIFYMDSLKSIQKIDNITWDFKANYSNFEMSTGK